MTYREEKFMEDLTKIAMEVAELRAENKLLKSFNDSLLQALHKPVVGGPGSDVRSEGEQLGNEAVEKSVCDGLHYCSLEKTRNADGTCAECGLPKRA